MRLLVIFGGAVLVAGAILFACVGSDSAGGTDSGGGDAIATGDSAQGTDGATDAGTDSAAQKPLTCGLENAAPITIGGVPDGGFSGEFDHERFGAYLLSDQRTIAIVGINDSNGGASPNVAGNVDIWTIDTGEGSPSPRFVGTAQIMGDRMLQSFRTPDGVGVVAFGHASGTYDFYVENFLELDMTGTPAAATAHETAHAVLPDQTFYASQGASATALATGDYFIVATNTNANGSSATAIDTVTARINGTIHAAAQMASQPIASGGQTALPSTTFLTGGQIHSFGGVGNFPTFAPADFVYDPTTAVFVPPIIPYPNDFMIASGASTGGTSILFADGDWEAGTASALRIGTVASVTAVAPSTFALLPVQFSALALGGGADVRFWTFTNHTPIVILAGPGVAAPGISFSVFGADGTVIANQPASSTGILGNLGANLIVSAVSIVAPSPPTVPTVFPVTWLQRNTVTLTDTIYYSRIFCAASP